MDFGCPVCTGLRQAKVSCRSCSNTMEDRGRLQDNFSDYSPYREIDDLRRTNGYLDLKAGQCMHVFFCERCGTEETLGITEEHLS